MKLKPIYYAVTADDDFEETESELKKILHRFLTIVKYVVFGMLCLAFIFVIGAGWGINHCDSKHQVHKYKIGKK